jgi:hypothetical protein
MMKIERGNAMLISEWKDGFGHGVWTAMNCVPTPHRNCGSKPPKIVGVGAGRNHQFGDASGFIAFGTDGAVMNMGEVFNTFEDAAKFLESVFVWRVPA